VPSVVIDEAALRPRNSAELNAAAFPEIPWKRYAIYALLAVSFGFVVTAAYRIATREQRLGKEVVPVVEAKVPVVKKVEPEVEVKPEVKVEPEVKAPEVVAEVKAPEKVAVVEVAAPEVKKVAVKQVKRVEIAPVNTDGCDNSAFWKKNLEETAFELGVRASNELQGEGFAKYFDEEKKLKQLIQGAESVPQCQAATKALEKLRRNFKL
jgi:hypothetical protein